MSEQLNPTDLEEAQRAQAKANSLKLLAVTDYAEWEKGLDPIGASDMLSDLYHYAMMLIAEQRYVDPETTWNQFSQERIKAVYGLEPF